MAPHRSPTQRAVRDFLRDGVEFASLRPVSSCGSYALRNLFADAHHGAEKLGKASGDRDPFRLGKICGNVPVIMNHGRVGRIVQQNVVRYNPLVFYGHA